MNYIIVGHGYIGKKFEQYLIEEGNSVSVVTRSDSLEECIKHTNPDFLINSAGYVGSPNVDQCEIERVRCLDDNLILPSRIMEICEDYKLNWGHVSSGCIYSGRRPCGGGWREADRPNFSFTSQPCSFYSGTKALAEEVLSQSDRCYVWRIRVPYSCDMDDGRDYLGKVMRYDKLLDVENSLTSLWEFIEAAVRSVEEEIPFGIYNMTNPGSLTTRYLTDILIETGISTKKFKFFRNEESFMKHVLAPRSSCVLDTSKLEKTGIRMLPVEESVRNCLLSY